MKALKIIITIIVILIAIPLVVALFVKKDYAVEREITINRPSQQVFDYIRLLKNQDQYSVWAMRDPQMKRSYSGTDGTAGFVASWESADKHVGKGSQTITRVVDGQRIESLLHFEVPFEAKDQAYMTTEAISPDQTRVTWGFTGSFPYPMNIMQLFMNMDKAVGNDLSTGLERLKQILEH